jgi:hypothetical protein
MQVGRPADPRRALYAERFGLNLKKKAVKDALCTKMLDRLDRCRDDDFRKVLMGITDMPMFPKPKDRQVTPIDPEEKIAIRKAVYERDEGCCVDCGKPVTLQRGFWHSMDLMHIKSKGSGGGWEMSNLLTGCRQCHSLRHNGSNGCPKKVSE